MIQSCYLEKCLIKIPAITMIWTLRNLPYQSHFIYGTTFFNQQMFAQWFSSQGSRHLFGILDVGCGCGCGCGCLPKKNIKSF